MTSSWSSSASKLENKLDKKREQALQQTLAAWLNFAKGGILWDEVITVDDTGTGNGGTRSSGTGAPVTLPETLTLEELIAEVKAILHNPDATLEELERAKDLAESANKHNKGNPDCDTASGSSSKGRVASRSKGSS